MIDNRNYYTHYDENSDFKKDIEKLITLNFKLKLLIELCILNELDFNDEFIENKLKFTEITDMFQRGMGVAPIPTKLVEDVTNGRVSK